MRVFGSRAARADLAGAPDFRPVPTARWPGILRKFIWMRDRQVSRFVGAGPLLTDDHPLIEYSLLSTFSGGANNGPVFERAAVETGLVIICLLVLLGAGLTWEAVSRRRAAARK